MLRMCVFVFGHFSKIDNVAIFIFSSFEPRKNLHDYLENSSIEHIKPKEKKLYTTKIFYALNMCIECMVHSRHMFVITINALLVVD